jgi:hypothetical protein
LEENAPVSDGRGVMFLVIHVVSKGLSVLVQSNSVGCCAASFAHFGSMQHSISVYILKMETISFSCVEK